MSFKNDVPNYKSYREDKYHMQTVPNAVWSELEGLIRRYSNDASTLKGYLNRFSEIIPCEPTTNWGWDFLASEIGYFVRCIKNKVTNGRFDIFMDCMGALVDCVSGRDEEINDFFEEHKIGYYCTVDTFNIRIHWHIREDSDIVDEMSSTKSIIKSASQQAYDEFENAIRSLENSKNERSRKDAVRSCVSALEAVIKAYGNDDEIGNATKILRAEKVWGLEDIVKEGHSIFNTMHRLYPDLRHGSTEVSTMSIEEAEYWIGRISNYLKYMQKMAKKMVVIKIKIAALPFPVRHSVTAED